MRQISNESKQQEATQKTQYIETKCCRDVALGQWLLFGGILYDNRLILTSLVTMS